MKDRQKVLVVDDTPENIQLLMETLKDDYDIVGVVNGKRALRVAATKPLPDIILLDVMMPEMDGYQVCARLKADPVTRGIPIIFITAMGQPQDEARGLALGAIDYIAKPFIPALVKNRIANHLELKIHRDNLEYIVRKRTEELALTQEATILCMASLAESRDPETGGHIRRTQSYVRLLADCLRDHPKFKEIINSEAVELLYLSTPLHDIGKVGVPDNILLKPGKLTEDEFEIMKTHAVIGHSAIQASEKKLGSNSFLRYAQEIAISHHEKWDGSGYPYGLKEEEIPVSGRLMALADVYDALISKRVYKAPFSHEKAVRIIIEGRGKHFDPDLIDVFIKIDSQFKQIALQFCESKEEQAALQEKRTC